MPAIACAGVTTMHPLPKVLPVVMYLAATRPTASAADRLPDLSKVDRTVTGRPTYVSKRPLFGLAVFGPKAEKSVWLVLDKSKADAGGYDVLHFGDRRLTAGKDGEFEIGDLTDPATGSKHTDVAVRVSDDKDKGDPTVMLTLRWKGDVKFGGGYPQDPSDGYMKFAPTRDAAPVVWVNGDAPFRFQRWYGGQLTIGAKDDFKVFLGQPGHGPNTFFAASQHFLPKDDWVNATLVYRDKDGKEQRVVCELKERC
jgi:hypothetical protein